MSSALEAINEAVDPKRVLRDVTRIPDPPAALVQNVIEKYEQITKRQNVWANAHTNRQGETFFYGGFGSRKANRVICTMLYYDRQSGGWRELNTLNDPVLMREAEEPGKPRPKIDPKRFFSMQKPKAPPAVEEILQYMPPEFVQAYHTGESADWENPYAMDADWWPSYDDDLADEAEEEGNGEGNPWREYIYYFDYRTEGGKLYAVAMSGDKDGDHDVCDEAEVGTPEYDRLVKEYGSDGWTDAMKSYWSWVIAKGGVDPLGYVTIDRVPVKEKWVVGFVRDGDRLRIWGLRNVSNPPSPPAVKWPALKEKAAQDPDWKKALEYCLVDDNGYTQATEENITNDGGKWKGDRLDLRFEWTDTVAAENEQERVLQVARESLDQLNRLGASEGD